MTRTSSPTGIRVQGRSHVGIEIEAARARATICPDLSSDEPVPGVPLFENLDAYAVQNKRMRYLVKELPPAVEGLTRYSADTGTIDVALSNRTYAGLRRGVPYTRFTLCHEIGHAVLHGPELVRLTQIPHLDRELARLSSNHEHCRDSEWQANRFASAILMPAPGLQLLASSGRLDVDFVMRRFGVSRPCATYRIQVFLEQRHKLLGAYRR